MPTVFIGGYYGAGNVGDEAILEAMVSHLRAQRSDLDLWVTSWNPDKTSRELSVHAVYWKDISGLIDAAVQADLILLGGGGIFHDYWGIDPTTYLRKSAWDITAFGSLPLLAALLTIPCMIYGVGVGPLQSEAAQQQTRLAFERCQIATLRDQESLDILRKTGFDVSKSSPTIEILADPVFGLSTYEEDEEWACNLLKEKGIDENTPLLGISLRYWEREGKPAEWLPHIAKGVRAFLENNPQVHVLGIPFQVLEATPFTNDVPVLKGLQEEIGLPERTHLIEFPLTPRQTQALIGRCSMLLGMRFHSLIMSMNRGVPGLALSIAHKISSVMHRFELDDFCLPISAPSSLLASKLQTAWEQRLDISKNIQTIFPTIKAEAMRHATLALELLSRSQREPLSFVQQFAVHQAKLILDQDDALQNYKNLLAETQARLDATQARLDATQARLDETQARLDETTAQLASKQELVVSLERLNQQLADRLREIESSRFVKIARAYYRVTQSRALRPVMTLLSGWKKSGTRKALVQAAAQVRANEETEQMKRVISALNSRQLKGVFVITSAFAFDEFYNQRGINLSKFLAQRNYGVVFVGWRWSKDEPMPIGREVYPNILQIPVDIFLQNLSQLEGCTHPNKYFVVEFPHPDFLRAALELKRYRFSIIYDLIDEWEEFYKVGQAPWFDADAERALVVNANLLTAISAPLVEKFTGLRSDIHLLPNGYTPSLLGEKFRNIARHHFERPKIHIGYFGYLTDSWFDWDLLLQVLDLAQNKGLNLHFDLVGDGAPDLEERLANHQEHISLHERVKPSALHSYVREWDIAMIPFRPGKLSEAVDPLKIYEYLYFGLPVIVTGITHLAKLPRVRVVGNAAEFLEALLAFKDETNRPQDDTNQKTQRAVERLLEESTWEQRFNKLLSLLETEQWMSL